MFKKSVGFVMLGLLFFYNSFSQVDTSYVYNTATPYGALDIRIAKSATRYYYLQEGKTVSFRESSPGVRSDTYRDMTSWDSSPYTQGNLREKNGTADAFVMNYRLLLPSNYNASYAEGYPLIIMMHGAGERGNCWDNTCFWSDRNWRPAANTPAAPTANNHELLNNDLNLLHGGQTHLAMRNAAGNRLPNDPTVPARSFPGFVLYPQNLNGWDPNGIQDAIKLLRLVSKKYKVDMNKIYIHGLSNGGYAVYEAVKRAPWLFAAGLPMSGISDAAIVNTGMAPKIATVPLWIFQGGIDTNPTPAKTQGYVKRFREAGMTIRYTKYANIGHGVWNTAYNEPDFFTWMRSKSKSDIHVFADNPVICQTSGQGVRMELSAGFLAYQWQLNGVTISGATSAAYVANTPGTYRARFSRKSTNPSEAQWNNWSAPIVVGSANPAQATVVQTGSVVLKDLNYYNNAQLSSKNIADHYYWYQNGVLLNLPGDQDDTTRTLIVKAGDCTGNCTGSGNYTLVTAAYNNCPSPASKPIKIYFSDQAPVSIIAPATFTGSATSMSTASLKWADSSTNEDGFEIWRRKVTNPASKWIMAGLTGPNATSFLDSGLDPNATYQYKIRAVGSVGRSNYTPAASNAYLLITTGADTQPPTIPQSLTAVNTGIQKIKLTWQASTDNTGIGSYNIYYNGSMTNTGTAVTNFTLTGLPLNTNFTFTVKAVDKGGNLSGDSNPATANTYVTGLYYQHSTGAYTDLDQVNWNIAEFTGKVNNFTLAPRTQEDYFTFQFDGYVYINTGGTYQFRTTSDDGSRLTLNNTVIVDNNGAHGNITITSANVPLTGGPQVINVKYFEYSGGQTLIVQYKGPDTGNNWINIPDSALKSGNNMGAATTMASASTPEPAAARVATVSSPGLETANVYPNPLPSGENVSVKLENFADGDENKVTGKVHVQLVDMMGNSLFENTFESDHLVEGAAIMPDKTLTKGIYLLVIKQGDTTVKRRVVVKE